ncbi:MAG TPA: anti-sigma factor [Solirubrobacteraceae bacterium]|jgi:anti-sigma factor RsiW|nr:anti-sigma factor [Solirubrobacteraceae bacterium]
MTACDAIRPQLGAYVLGGLEPEEVAEVREHLAHCPDCAREHAELVELPAKLDLIEAPDLALQRPGSNLEEAILDRHSRERRAVREHVMRERRPAPAPPSRRQRRGRRPVFGASGRIAAVGGAVVGGRRRALTAVAAGVAAAAIAVVLVVGGGANPVNPPSAVAAVLGAGPGAPHARGTAWLSAVPAGTAVRLNVGGLSRGKSYEMWCIRFDGRWVSAGTFQAGRDGRADVRLTAAVHRGEYGRIYVTPRASHEPAALRGAVTGY